MHELSGQPCVNEGNEGGMNSIGYRVVQVQHQIFSQGIDTNQGKVEIHGSTVVQSALGCHGLRFAHACFGISIFYLSHLLWQLAKTILNGMEKNKTVETQSGSMLSYVDCILKKNH